MSVRTLLLRLIFGLSFFLQLSIACWAQQNPDAVGNNADQGAADCPPLGVFPQLVMTKVQSCQRADSAEVTMPLKPDANGVAREKRIRGAYEYREYRISQSNEDSAFDNLVNLLPMAGFQVKYVLKPSTITGRKDNIWILIRISGDSYNVSMVRGSEELWTPVTSAEAISLAMMAHGSVDVYGIQFSPENQALQEKQSEILGEILKYLKQNANFTVTIESHRASQEGSPELDMEVTRKRANAVVAWLVAHGISRVRLRPKPCGRTQPLTENDTTIEVMRNDRIVLAKANT